MTSDKTTRQNRVREALGRLYDQHPPYFREYLRRFKEDPTSRVFAPLAEAYRRMGRVDEAIDICKEGLEHHPDFHGGRVALAKCYVDKRMFDEARSELDRVIQTVPENLLAQRLLGDCYLALDNKPAALHCYKMALLLSPSDVSLAEKVHGLERGNPVVAAEPPTEKAQALSLEDLPSKSAVSSIPSEGTSQSPIVPEWDDEDFSVMGVERRVEGGDPALIPFDDHSGLSPLLSPSAEEDELLEASEEERGKIDRLLGVDENDPEEAFTIEHVSAIFGEEPQQAKKEITTATLGDLYFSQGQFDRALRIFEKLQSQRPNQELARKINACRSKLGVDKDAIVRNRKIHALRSVLKRAREMRS